MKPTVSVVIPVYNQERHLEKCLRSVADQTYTDFECILSDDGSTDASGAICDCFAANDARFRVIHKENGGVGSARNAALDIIQGSYVAFIDSDDWVEKDYLESLYALLTKYQTKIAVCNYHLYYPEENRDEIHVFPNSCGEEWVIRTKDIRLNRDDYLIHVWGLLYDAEIFHDIRFAPDVFLGEDVLLNSGIYTRVDSIAAAVKPCYNYVVYPASASHGSFDEKKATLIEAWKRTEKNMKSISKEAGFSCRMCLIDEAYRAAWRTLFQSDVNKKAFRKLRGTMIGLLPSYLANKEKHYPPKYYLALSCAPFLFKWYFLRKKEKERVR